MKWLALFLFCIQAKWISSCVFDKVEGEISGHIYNITRGDVNHCLAECYNDMSCVGILHMKDGNQCHLFDRREPKPITCEGDDVCYFLQRYEVDAACQRYLNF